MPVTSNRQRNFMRLVHALQAGGVKPTAVSSGVRKAAGSMSPQQVEDFTGPGKAGFRRGKRKVGF